MSLIRLLFLLGADDVQVVKRRSFFVYQSELGLLKKVEGRLGVLSSQNRPRFHTVGCLDIPRGSILPRAQITGTLEMNPHSSSGSGLRPLVLSPSNGCTSSSHGIQSAILSPLLGIEKQKSMKSASQSPLRRPRASTLPAFIPDHQSWFDDARFDGSFPSRVLPFLYLGNL